jgi:hypothetical protein
MNGNGLPVAAVRLPLAAVAAGVDRGVFENRTNRRHGALTVAVTLSHSAVKRARS